MQRCYRVPIEQSSQPTRIEQCALLQSTLGFSLRLHKKLEPCLARQFHFCTESQHPVALDRNDSPEIERFTIADRFRITSTTAKTRTTSQNVDPTTNLPEPVRRIPSVPSTDTAHGSEYSPVRSFNQNSALVAKDCSAGPVWIPRNDSGHRPVCFDLIFCQFAQGRSDCVPNREQFLRYEFCNLIFAADNRILESLRQRLCNVVAERRDQVDPIRTQARRQYWNRK